MSKKIKVIAFVIVDKDLVNLFLHDGSLLSITSDQYNLNKLIKNLEQTLPWEMCLDDYLIKKQCQTVEFKIFNKNELNDLTVEKFKQDKSRTTFTTEIDLELAKETIGKESVIVGLVNGIIVPYVDKLKKYTTFPQNKKGLENFLKKLKTIYTKSQHTAEQLLDFLEQAELPLTNEGNIIGYKKLRKHEDYYVDLHSNKVIQNIGYTVEMSKSQVDPNRKIDCSYGLHVASLNYLAGFGSEKYGHDDIFFVIVDPRDVISVPEYDITKLRCSKYKIVNKLNEAAYKLAHNKQIITSDKETAILMKNIVKSKYPVSKFIRVINNTGKTINFKTNTFKKQKYKQSKTKQHSLNTPENILLQSEIKELKSLIKKLKLNL